MSKFFEDSSEGYTTVREEIQAKMKPNFPLILRELIQNVPWSAQLDELNLRMTKVSGTDNREVLLEMLDNDYGCTYETFKKSVLSKITKSGFGVKKEGANKFGQGISNIVPKSSTGQLELQMKKDGKAWKVIMDSDADRSRKVYEIDNSVIKGDSGFYFKIPLKITNKSWKISTPEVMAQEFYNIIKQDCHFNLGRVKVSLELVGFDMAFTQSFSDLDCIQKRGDAWVTNDLSTTTSIAPNIIDKPTIYDFQGSKIRISKIEVGKRVGKQESERLISMNEEEYKKKYFLAEQGDMPVAIFKCSRTGLLYPTIIPLRAGTTGQLSINHCTVICTIDIQDECWGVDQTKESIMTPMMEDYLKGKMMYLAEGIYPTEAYREKAFQSWLFDTYTEGDDLNAERLRHDSGISFTEDMTTEERLKHICKEDDKGKNIYDFSLNDEDTISIPVEVKPKPFKANEFRQVLDYYVSEESEKITMIGLDVGKEKISELHKKVDGWKKGKMSKLARWEYLDGRKYGYNKIVEREYINRVRDAMSV